MPIAPYDIYTQSELTPSMFPERMLKAALPVAANQHMVKGAVVGLVTSNSASDVQTLTQSSATGGSFTITFGFGTVYTTAPIAYNASAATVQAALQALPNIGASNVTCTGGALGSAGVVCNFTGALANQPQPLMAINNAALTGSGAVVTVAHTTQGVANGTLEPYVSTNTDGSQTPVGILVLEVSTDAQGNVSFGPLPTGNGFGAVRHVAPIAISGYFNTADLTGLDANAVAKLGRLIDGTTSSGVLCVTGA
ncbi:MAG: hypothetical protein P4L46_17535 [Fimbriimonas sp.]|nr:hypothetical protein [Fimbriimonas sp.]